MNLRRINFVTDVLFCAVRKSFTRTGHLGGSRVLVALD
jgi:hypothetical protein